MDTKDIHEFVHDWQELTGKHFAGENGDEANLMVEMLSEQDAKAILKWLLNQYMQCQVSIHRLVHDTVGE
jgi:hypothetical protein